MKTTKPKTPRKKRVDQELYDRAWESIRNAQAVIASVSDELRRVQEASARTYELLKAERGELLARADKLLAVMKALELRTENQGSPVTTRVDRWT